MNHFINNYLTFYHEIGIPKNDFFSINGQFEKPVYIISSPSRMGNHLIMSMLDSHPCLPRIAGEDGFLTFGFIKANHDISDVLNNKNNAEFFFNLNFNNSNKWKKYLENKDVDKKYSGIKIQESLAIRDYKDIDIEIDYEKYSSNFFKHFSNKNATYFEIFKHYLDSFKYLDKQFLKREEKYLYEAGFCYSGMRSQCLWLLENGANVKIISSLRQFDSYAYSHIVSRYGIESVNDEDKIKEAFEHWYHKLIDYIYLKTYYPNNVLILIFDELQDKPKVCANILTKFLNIPYHESLIKSTTFGIETTGNPSNIELNNTKGSIYTSTKVIDKSLISKYQLKVDTVWNEVLSLKGYNDEKNF